MPFDIELPDGRIFPSEAQTPEQARAEAAAYLRQEAAARRPQIEAEIRANRIPVLSAIDDAVRGAADTVTFGLADEAAAGLRALTETEGAPLAINAPNTLYNRYTAYLEQERAKDRLASTTPRVAGQIGGAFLPGGAIARGVRLIPKATRAAEELIPQVPGILGRIGRGALGGLTGGLAYGFGSGEGDIGTGSNALFNRALSAALGGTVGAVGGAALGPIVGAIGQRLAPTRAIPEAAASGTTGFRPTGYEKLAADPTVALSTLSNAIPYAGPLSAAERQLLNAIGKDRLSAAALGREILTYTPDQPVTIADLGGNATRELLRVINTAGGRPGSILAERAAERAAGQEERLRNAVRQNISGRNIFDAQEEIVAAQQAAAAPTYREAYAFGPVNDPRIVGTFNTPAIRDISGEAKQLQELERAAGIARGLPPEELPNIVLPSIEPTSPTIPDVRTLDYIQRALYGGVKRNTNERGELNPLGRQYQDTRRAIIDTLDPLVPKFREARQAFAGPEQQLEAIQQGRQIFRQDPEEITRFLANATEGERDIFPAGVARAVLDKINQGEGRPGLSKDLLRSRRQQLRAALGSEEAYNQFVNDISRQARLMETDVFARGGSQTSPRQTQLNEYTNALGLGADILTGNRAGLINRAYNALGGRMLDAAAAARRDRVNEELIDLIYNPDFATNRQILARLLQQRPDAAPTAGSVAGGELGASTEDAFTRFLRGGQ